MVGDGESRSRAIEAHLPLVRSIARRYSGRGEPVEDLVQVGSIGLIKAVDRFDPSRGPSLAALARPSIESEIRHHLRDRSSLVRVPRTDQELAARLLAGEQDLSAGEVDRAKAAGSAQPVLLEADRAPAPDDSGAVEARLLLARGSEALDERERRLLHLRYVEDRNQAEIASELGLSQAHVSRLLRAALEHLRSELDGDPAEPIAEEPAKHRSGRLLLRLPQSLHGELAAAAQREGVALNTFIAGTLAAAIAWHDPDGELHLRRPRRSRLLLVNAIVITLAALTGIALLLVAWLG
jgi:RNA polymerase sigma-B factor